MKRLFVIALLCFAFSCSKDAGKEESVSTTLLSSLTKEVIGKPTILQLRQGYSLLSASEKENLWDTKFKILLKNSRHNLTSEQRKIVVMIGGLLQENGMQKLIANPQIGEAFVSSTLEYFSKHFSKDELYLLIESHI